MSEKAGDDDLGDMRSVGTPAAAHTHHPTSDSEQQKRRDRERNRKRNTEGGRETERLIDCLEGGVDWRAAVKG